MGVAPVSGQGHAEIQFDAYGIEPIEEAHAC